MPELPEVETIRRILGPQLASRRIEQVILTRPEVVAHPEPSAFCARVTGRRIGEMGRRGKYLTMALDSGDTLILHLRMTGQLLVTPPDFPEERHTHLRLLLEGGEQLRFIDLRRFGRFWLKQVHEEDTFSGLGKLGLEPLEGGLTASWLSARYAGRRRSIKECLLDQGGIAGIGNIYADEILFAARISPARPANTLEPDQWQRLAEAIPAVLRAALESDVLSAGEYLAGLGRTYRRAPFFQVYGRAGQPCPACGAPLARATIAGRGSYSCPHCQPPVK